MLFDMRVLVTISPSKSSRVSGGLTKVYQVLGGVFWSCFSFLNVHLLRNVDSFRMVVVDCSFLFQHFCMYALLLCQFSVLGESFTLMLG